MRTKVYIGIDPGLSGGVAAISDKGELLMIEDTPALKAKTGTKVYLPAQMAEILKRVEISKVAVVGIEQVHSMPKQGVASSFRFGEGFGMWQGIIAALGMPMMMVPPQRWKKAMLAAGAGSDKGVAIARAQQLLPSAAKYLTRKKDDGRAEAILIAMYFLERIRSTPAHFKGGSE